jgi:hypothetical protein
MSYDLIESPIELTDDQLDMVAAGHGSFIDVDADVELENTQVGVLTNDQTQINK